jgi:hypothetical protein
MGRGRRRRRRRRKEFTAETRRHREMLGELKCAVRK